MISQLLIVKRLFLEARPYVERLDPISAGIAVSLYQDAVELYVWTLIKKRDLAIKDQSSFVSNMEALQKAGVPLANVARLLELNKARVGFKHYGNLPAPVEAKKHQTYVEDFLRQGMPEHFEVNFDDLSLADLIADEAIREELHSTEATIASGKYREAVEHLAKAKALTFAKLERYLPGVDARLRDSDKLLNAIPGVRRAESFKYLAEYLQALREATLVALLQLSIEDYAFLQESLPVGLQYGRKWQLVHRRTNYTEAESRRALAAIVSLCQSLEARQ
jgi:hypothetical protein